GSEISIAEKGYFSFVEFFIRKGAHFFTYFVLGGSLFLTLVFRKQPYWLAAFFAWLAATGYAGIDEYHQMLTGGRTPLFQDVMLDSAGPLTAVLLGWLICQLSKKSPKRRKT
ncbi:VanZ family protein, partial [Klebsiella michiganensis]|nr:VanZ family protein [Klebsiella michiganensis]